MNGMSAMEIAAKELEKLIEAAASPMSAIEKLREEFEEFQSDVTEELAKKADKSEILMPKKHYFGGQLAKLKESLSNPLEQITSIVFIGDSITWGSGVSTAPNQPRDATLSDPRDVFETLSFVNLFKRYIGLKYARNASPVLSNWFASPSGESTVEYTVQHILYPKEGDFTVQSVGSSQAVDESPTSLSITGYQLRLADGDPTGNSYQSIKFNFTGSEFTLSLGCLDADATYYDLYVDGVKIGTYSTFSGQDGFVNGKNDNRRKHTFPYVRNKTVEIRTNRNGLPTGTKRLRVEGIIIDKVIRITNQGIIGINSKQYKTYNMPGNPFGDGDAIGEEDNYIFCQLGTNDRIIRNDMPRGSNEFKKNLNVLVDSIIDIGNPILMCANPANTNPTQHSFTMQEVRNVIYRLAKDRDIDMIDNYILFDGLDLNYFTTDGIHPNAVGHYIIYKNIVNSLENSE